MDFALPPGVRRLPLVVAGTESVLPMAVGSDVGQTLGTPRTDANFARATQADAGLAALLADESAKWTPADEELARFTAASRKPTADPQQQLDEVLSSVGDWLDPLDELLSFAKSSR